MKNDIIHMAFDCAQADVFCFDNDTEVREYHAMIHVNNAMLPFAEQLEAVLTAYHGLLNELSGAHAVFKRYFLSDAANQADAVVLADVTDCAKSVIQLEMMPKLPDTRTENNPWPEWPRVCKTDYGQEEAAAVYGSDPRVYQTTVKELISDENGKLRQAVLVKLDAEKDEATGRLRMIPIEGSEYTVDAELILIAAGFLGSESYVTSAFGVELDGRTNVQTANGTHKTSVDRVFAAGDMRRGQSLVVWAIREGRDCAREVDESLMGYTNL